MFDLQSLFAAARANPKIEMNNPLRLMGRHCRATVQRAVAKRVKAGKTPYAPFGRAAFA